MCYDKNNISKGVLRMIWWAILGCVVVFLCVLLLRTARFRPRAQKPVETSAVTLDEEKILRDMQDMVRCKPFLTETTL